MIDLRILADTIRAEIAKDTAIPIEKAEAQILRLANHLRFVQMAFPIYAKSAATHTKIIRRAVEVGYLGFLRAVDTEPRPDSRFVDTITKLIVEKLHASE